MSLNLLIKKYRVIKYSYFVEKIQFLWSIQSSLILILEQTSQKWHVDTNSKNQKS